MSFSIWTSWLRVYITGAGIIGTGVLLYKYTTPTDEELIKALSPEIRQQYEREKNLRQAEQQELMRIVKETASSNDPIWMTGSIQSPWEAEKRVVQTRDQFQKAKAEQVQKEELERIRKELALIRQHSDEKTREYVAQKSWWKPWQ